ncbi:MAG: COG1361 family protein [Methanotrichaceae archaeon]
MRLIYLAVFILLILPVLANSDDNDDDETVSREFTLNVGDGVKIGDYRVELVNIVSVRDGLVETKIWKRVSDFEEWRVMEEHRDTNFGEGADHGGLTLTVIEIFDDEAIRMRAEYRKDYGYPRKYVTERAMAPKNLPKLTVDKNFDKTNICAGDEVKVTIAVKNVGNDTARDIAVLVSPPLSQFRYLAGYPPKIKSELGPGESDFAIYSMVAVTEGEIKVPATVLNYADAKNNIYSVSSPSFNIAINPKRKPNLELSVDPVNPIEYDGTGIINVTVLNNGEASAYRIEINEEINPANGGIEVVENSLKKNYFEIGPGASETYSTKVRGHKSGNYAITLKASYQSEGEMMQKETSFEVLVLKREYKYLYYVPIVPALIIVVWIFRRHKEYKY